MQKSYTNEAFDFYKHFYNKSYTRFYERFYKRKSKVNSLSLTKLFGIDAQ